VPAKNCPAGQEVNRKEVEEVKEFEKVKEATASAVGREPEPR